MKKITFLFVILLASASLFAQVNITGVVTSADDGQPLPGVNVITKGTVQGVTTDVDGNYAITVSEGVILQFSYVGYETFEATVTAGQTTLNIGLEPSATMLDEMVVLGYATVKKENVTGSVSAVDFNDMQSLPSTNTASLLQGKMTGVSISNFGTQPGKEDPNIIIRGSGTFNAGQAPLVLVDGVESSLGQIPPGDIKSVSVLKDAASASIYGVRAANGVILVTTKSGKKGQVTVDFNTNFSLQQNLVKSNLLESYDFANITNGWLEANGEQPWYTAGAVDTIQNGLAPNLYANTNWEEEAFRKALMQTYYLAISGGGEKVSYRFSSEILDQEGIMLGTSSNRYNLRSNVEAKINDKLKVGVNIFGYKKHLDENLMASEGDGATGLNYLLRRNTLPTVPVYYTDGNYGFVDGAYETTGKTSMNMPFEAQKGKNYTDLFHVEAKTYLEWEIIENLVFNTSFSFTSNNLNSTKFTPTYVKYDSEGGIVNENTVNSLLNVNRRNHRYKVENILTYTKKINKHNLGFLLGQSSQMFREDFFMGYAENFATNEIYVLGAGVNNRNVDGDAFEHSLLSFFGRANYNYDERYLFEFNLRRDGSSRMPEDNRFAVFPSLSAGWVVSNEAFFTSVEQISMLKLRGSWGQLGNQEIGNYAFEQGFSTGLNYVVNNVLVGGVAVTELANPNITWETTTITDIGVDFNLFGDNVMIVADWFNKTSTDVLVRLPIPSTLGVQLAPYQNVGKVQNKGWEFAIQYQNNFGDLYLFANANISMVDNEILELGDLEDWIDGPFLNEVGSAMGSLYGLQAEGYLTEADFDADGNLNPDLPSQYGTLKPGDVKYRDISGPDGVPDGEISEDWDRVVIGDPYADYSYGFAVGGKYKGIDLSIFFQGVNGIDRFQWYNNEIGGNFTNAILDYWTPINTNANFPSLGNEQNNNKYSSFWVKDASYLRLKNLEIGYTIPVSASKKVGIKSVRVYFSGQNLLTFTKMVDYDPERRATDLRASSYPQSKVFSMGLNLTF